MTLALILAAVLCAIVLGMFGWRRSSCVLAWATLLVFLAIGCGLVPKLLLPALQGPYAIRPATAWASSNAIVLLTAGSSYARRGAIEPGSSAFGRITEAAILYRDCKRADVRCTLLISGGDANAVGEPLSVTYMSTLVQLGVASPDIVLETHSLNTWQNAEFSRPLLRAIAAQRVWLVTSAYHMRRSLLCFEHFGIDVTPMRADYLRNDLSVWPTGANLELTDSALHEILGIAAYHFYQLTGWNFLATVLPPGPSSS